MISDVNPAGFALSVEAIDVLVTATGAAFNRNDVVQLPIDSDGGYTTCITPTAAGIGTVASAICSDAVFAVVLSDYKGFGVVAQNDLALVRIRGLATPVCLSTADASITIDGQFFPNTSKQLEFDQAGGDANKKVVALACTSTTGGGGATSTPATRQVFFDGLVGFCRNGGSAS